MTMLREDNQIRQVILTSLMLTVFISAGNALEVTRTGQSVADGVSVSVGLEFDSGDYGTADTTDTWRIPLSLDYRKGQYFAGLSIPYISAKSTGTITLSSGSSRMRTVTTTSATVSKSSGMGDLNLYAGYNFPTSKGESMAYHVTAHIKLATADENKGLGTGENDYAIEGGIQTKIDKSNIFASIGYQIMGDSAAINYDNVLYANVGFSIPTQQGRMLGAMLDYSQAATPGLDDSIELTGFMNITLADKRNLYFYALVGLSDGSPDYGVGASYRFAY